MDQNQDPEAVARDLAPRLARLIITLRRDTATAGLTRAQLTVLRVLSDGDPRRITELADIEQVTQPSMTVLLTRMERLGWVARQRDDTDRRGVRVRITDHGRTRLARASAVYAEALAGRLRRLEPNERAALAAAVPALDAVLAGESDLVPA